MESEDVPDVTGTDYKGQLYVSYDHDVPEEKEEPVKTYIIDSTFNKTGPHINRYEVDIYDLSRKKSASFLSIFIVMGCIVVIGVLCNIIVCYIYRCRARRATSNFFVIFFSIFDMMGCLIGIPLEVAVLALPYTYDLVPFCKIMGFVETLSICALCLTLTLVSYDCYRKLCRTTESFEVKKVRTLCIVTVVLAVLVSTPAFAVFDIKTVRTGYPGVFGKTCGITPEMPKSVRIVYYVCVLSTFTICLTIMSVLYSLIGVNVLKRRQAEERGEKPSPSKKEFPKKHRFVREDTCTSSVTNYNDEICRIHSQSSLSHSHHSDPARAPLKSSTSGGGVGVTKTNSLQASSGTPGTSIVQLHMKHTRQAWIFLIISIIFVIAMLPYVVVSILCMATNVFDQFSSETTEIVFNLCIRSYLLNYIVKPIVYIIFNLKFRLEVKQMFLKVWSLCTRSSAEQHQQQAASRQLRRSFTMGAKTKRSTSHVPIYRPPPAST